MAVKILPYDIKTVREWVAFQRQFDVTENAVEGNATQLSRRVTGLASGATHYVSLEVPAGKVFVLFSRGLNLGEGLYHVDVVSASGGFSGGAPVLKQPLNGNAPVATNGYTGSTPAGTVTELTNDVVDNGSGPGGQSVSGSTDLDGVIKIFPEGHVAALRITQDSNGPSQWYYNIDIIGWELDAEA